MELKKTITSIFFVPTLGIPKGEIKKHDFINGYSRDVGRDIEYEDSAFLLFHPTDLDKFRIFLDSEYERTKSLIEDYDYPDGFVVVVYQLNPEFKADFDLVKLGKYSKTSPAFQNLFPKVVKITVRGLERDEISLQYRVFNKTQDLVQFWEDQFGMNFTPDLELWRGFNEEDETLNLGKVKEKISKQSN